MLLQLSAFIKYIVLDFNKRNTFYRSMFNSLTRLSQGGMKSRNLIAKHL